MKNKKKGVIALCFIVAVIVAIVIGQNAGKDQGAATPEATVTVEVTATPEATEEPTAEPTEEPTAEPTEEPTAEPTEEPTAEPTEEPTAEPTEEPTAEPTEEPTAEPTEEPTAEPTEEPTAEPTEEPTAEPTEELTAEPTEEPTAEPTEEPTAEPTEEPTAEPTEEPTLEVTEAPEATEEPEETEAPEAKGYQIGDTIEDFSFTTYDGQTYTLYGLLEEKQMVLLNFWATWCGPCRSEFPMMNEAYLAHKDQIEVVALTTEAEDTFDVLKEFAPANSMTFLVGRDETDLYGTGFNTGYIPTTVVVDRFHTICYFEYGSVTSVDAFNRLFDIYVGDDYTESVLLPDGLPAKLPDVEPADPADLAKAVGEGLTFVNPTDDEYNWPVKIVTGDDRDYIATTNMTQGNSISSVDVQVTAAAGDVLAMDYKVSSEESYDFLTVMVNDEVVKQLSGEVDWRAYAYKFEADGDYTVTLTFLKDEASDDGDDAAYFDNIRLLTGDEAAAALDAMPVYPHAEATTLTVANEDAKQILIDDPTGLLAGYFAPDATYYVIPGDTAKFVATLAEGNDAEAATIYSFYDKKTTLLADCVDGEAYSFTTGINSMETNGASYCYVNLTAGDQSLYVIFFNSEQNLNTFFDRNFKDEAGNFTATWSYADGSERVTTPSDLAAAPAAE